LWITFQLLSALAECHQRGIYHGDIKMENVLVTSWNWILLSDFANFKPTHLPEDDPTDFAYFFDSAMRRSCYIAPERFHSHAEYHIILKVYMLIV
jgi:phosphoinositide-3-kinase regulatory subunit 4